MAVRDEVPDHHRFGPFLLEPGRRSLTRNGTPVVLSARAFDLLLALLQRRDQVVSKDELRRDVWRGMVVDDNNLAVQISVLRRALGEQPGGAPYILTVPGRGYQFVAALEGDAKPESPVARAAPEAPPAVADMSSGPPARKHRVRVIAAGLVALALAGWFALPHLRPAAIAPRLSIAVLPFRNLSADPDQDYLADAISDDLTTDLSHIPGSTVIARASADTFRTRTVAADAIGRALNVRYLLEGSLRAEGGSLHINAQLIDAPTGSHLWARAFDVERDKLGAARTDIVRNIASALDFTLAEVEGARSLHDRPDNPDAVDFYLRARSVLGRGNTLESLTEAQNLLEKAVALAPDFADALAGLGTVLVRKMLGFDDPTELADQGRAENVVARAMALAPRNAAVIAAKGYLDRDDGRCRQARASFALAISLDPNDVLARAGLAMCSRDLGLMEEVIAEEKELLRIDPASAANAGRQYTIGMANLMLGTPRDALAWFDLAGAGLHDPAKPDTSLGGWQEWRQIYVIAATQLTGQVDAARHLYEAYDRVRPYRTVWRLGSYNSRAVASLPGCRAYLAALKAAGMPEYADEDRDFGVAPEAAPHEGGDFDPTPRTIPPAIRIGTNALHERLMHSPTPVVVDVAHAAVVPPGTSWIWSDNSGDLRRLVDRIDPVGTPGERPVVVMGDGPVGWASYNAALQLVARGYRSVLWYRGGGEAWAASGYPSDDLRPQ